MTILSHSRLLLPLIATLLASTAHADPYTDEANRQAQMASMRAQDAANDRAAADRSFQAGLAAMPSGGGGAGMVNSGYNPSGQGWGSVFDVYRSGPPKDMGPQSVVSRRTLIVQTRETPQQVVTRLRGAATAGDAGAAFDLARVLYTGYGGVPRNDVEARKWFAMAADKGNANAQAQLGYMAFNGLGGPIDKALALAQTAKAAAQGDIYGGGLYGFYKLDVKNPNVPQPDLVGKLERAADAGHLFAQATLGGIVYLLGVGAQLDNAKAAKYLKLAAASGHPQSQVDLARLMADGKGVPQDNAGAAALLNKAAAAGNAEAMYFLGAVSMSGQLANAVPRDTAKGYVWYRKAAEAGHPHAQALYGEMLMFGEGVPKDMAAAARFLRKAAESGNSQAQGKWGLMLFMGEGGVPVDKRQAIIMMRKAAASGDKDAIEYLKADEVVAAIAELRI